MSKQVSAIVSAYYSEQFFTQRIDNLLNQSMQPEVVVVTNVDEPEWKMAEAFGDDVLLVVGDEEHFIPTVYKAWNAGIMACHGEYVTNANTDDVYTTKNAISLLSAALDSHPQAQVVYPNVSILDGYNGKEVNSFDWMEGGFKELILEGCFLGPMPMWRKSLHDTVGYFDEKFETAGDYEFWLRVSTKFDNPFHHIKQNVGKYARRKSSLENKSYVRTTWESSLARAKYRHLLDEV